MSPRSSERAAKIEPSSTRDDQYEGLGLACRVAITKTTENTKQFEYNFMVRNETRSPKKRGLPYQHKATIREVTSPSLSIVTGPSHRIKAFYMNLTWVSYNLLAKYHKNKLTEK